MFLLLLVPMSIAQNMFLVKNLHGKSSILKTDSKLKQKVQNFLQTLPDQREDKFEYSIVETRRKQNNPLRWDYIVKHRTKEGGDKEWDYVVQHTGHQHAGSKKGAEKEDSESTSPSGDIKKKDDFKAVHGSKSRRWDNTKWCNGFYIEFGQSFAKEMFSYDEYLKS